jgi:hypothetical protein
MKNDIKKGDLLMTSGRNKVIALDEPWVRMTREWNQVLTVSVLNPATGKKRFIPASKVRKIA